MDYTTSPQFAVHPVTGNRLHDDAATLPTVLTDDDINQLTWSIMEVVKDAELVPSAFNKDAPATYRQLAAAIDTLIGRALAGTNAGVGLGVGQTWQNMTSARLDSVYYLNATGKPIEVAIQMGNSQTNSGGSFFLLNNATSEEFNPYFVFMPAGMPDVMNITVPVGFSYKYVASQAANLLGWLELR